MPKGPIGGPRPFTEHTFKIDPRTFELEVVKKGPFGVRRPFARDNPEVPPERVAECITSQGGKNFAVKVHNFRNGDDAEDFEDLSVPDRRASLENAAKWCEGILEATSKEDKSVEEVIRDFTEVAFTQGQTQVTEGDDAFDKQFQDLIGDIGQVIRREDIAINPGEPQQPLTESEEEGEGEEAAEEEGEES